MPLPLALPLPRPLRRAPAPGALTGAWTRRGRAAPAPLWPWRHWGPQPRPSAPPRSRGAARAARGTTGTRQGCAGEALIAPTGQGHEAERPRRDLSALGSPGPTLEQQLRRPRAAPSASTPRSAMSERDGNGDTGTARDRDTALPRRPSVPPPHRHLKVAPAAPERVPVLVFPRCPRLSGVTAFSTAPRTLPAAPVPVECPHSCPGLHGPGGDRVSPRSSPPRQGSPCPPSAPLSPFPIRAPRAPRPSVPTPGRVSPRLSALLDRQNSLCPEN